MTKKSAPKFSGIPIFLALLATGFLFGQTASAGNPKPTTVGTSACDDATIAAQVKEALSKERLLQGQHYRVEVKDRVVTLFGATCNAARKNRAAGIAKKVKCVKKVANNITIGGSLKACAGETPCCCCDENGCECQARAGGACCIQPKPKL